MENFLSFDTYNILLSFGISFLIQIFFFAFAATLKTDKVTDLSYGLTFVILSAYLLLSRESVSTGSLIVGLMVILWGIRLALYLFVRIIKIKRDKRFDGIRENFSRFAKFWILQGVAIAVIMMPATVYLSSTIRSLSNLSLVVSIFGVLIWSAGLIMETFADAQKFRFKNNPDNKGKWIATGLWKYSRHPNYFGEMLVWWGIFIYVLPALSGLLYLTVLGPILITYLLLYGTGIPTLEKKYDVRYADDKEYQEYKSNTRLLVPLPK